jgi:hypothetical protein
LWEDILKLKNKFTKIQKKKVNLEMVRIALISALIHSPGPIEKAFKELWPTPILQNVIDTSLSVDLPTSTDDDMQTRISTLAEYAIVKSKCDAILFTCSAFGIYIDKVSQSYSSTPILKPTQGLTETILSKYSQSPILLVATFEPTLKSLESELKRQDTTLNLNLLFIPGALDALDKGKEEEHDKLVSQGIKQFLSTSPNPTEFVIALSQFSLARASPYISKDLTNIVLTTPNNAVLALKSRLQQKIRNK